MSAVAGLVDVTKSMIVIDPDSFPVNLQKVYREDLPDASFKILAYEASNVMPTSVGYRSYFSNYTLLGVEPVPSAYCQWVLSFQTADYSTILIAACEEGLWWCGATQGIGATQWQQLVAGNSVNPAAPVFHLWTHAVIANKLYVYLQGQDKFYCFGTIPDIDNLVSANTNFPDAKVKKEYQATSNYQFAFASIVPSFLNMTGQVGLFRADNRLGFWDSDNAVAWSSAIYIPDFEPSTETFAGITTFADVVGAITMIYGHGNDFIIYSTRSIVQAKNVEGSNEKWAGSAILSDTGVSFYNQIAPGQPDTTQYALTSSGLCRIQNSVPQFFETEVSDYLMENNDYYALSYIDGRYLFMHSTNALVPSVVQVEGKPVVSADNNTYYFVQPTIPTAESSVADIVGGMLNGADPRVQGDFSYSAISEAGLPGSAANSPGYGGQPNIPFYSGHKVDKRNLDFNSYDESTGKFIVDLKKDQTLVFSRIAPTLLFHVDYQYMKPRTSFWQYGDGERFLDKAGDDLYEIQKDAIQNIAAQTKAFQQLIKGDMSRLYSIVPVDETGQTSNAKYAPNLTLPMSYELEYELVGQSFENMNLLLENVLLPEYLEFKVDTSSCQLNYTGIPVDVPLRTRVKVREVVQAWEGIRVFNYFDVNFAREGDAAVYMFTIGFTYDNSTVTGVIPIGNRAVTLLSANLVGSFAEYKKYKFPDGIPKPRYPTYTKIDAGGGVSRQTSPIENWEKRADEGSFLAYSLANWLSDTEQFYRAGFIIKRRFMDSVKTPPDHIPNACFPAGSTDYHTDWVNAFGSTETIYNDTSVYGAPGFAYSQAYCTTSDGMAHTTETFYGYADTMILCNAVERNATTDPRDYPIDEQRLYNQMEKGVRIEFPEFYVEIDEEKLVKRDRVALMDAEISGFGVKSLSGGGYVKTTTRYSGAPCNPQSFISKPVDPNEGGGTTLPGLPENPPTVPTPTINPPTPPDTWPYPEPVVIPDVNALFRKGTPAPFYPTYEAAIVYDFLLEKYGRYSHQHKQIFSLLPTNRADSTVTPVKDLGLRGGFLRTDRRLGYFSGEATDSEIVYGRFGSYRLGVTRGTKAVARFGKKASGVMIVECSLDGNKIDRSMTQAITFTNLTTVEFFFTRTAKWFNIRIRGQFELIGLSFESDPRGRR